MKIFSFSLLLSSAVILFSCGNSEPKKHIFTEQNTVEEPTEDFKKYYFPVDSFTTPQIYHYVSEEENPDMYWLFQTITENDKTYFLTDSYAVQEDGTSKIVETIKEEIKPGDGAYIISYTEFQKDHNGATFPAVAKMNSSCVFKWSLKTTEPLVWSFDATNANNPDFLQKTSKTRNYTGNKSTFLFENDSIEALEFKDVFHLEMINTKNGRNKIYDFSQESYYAENIGMYKYIRTIQETVYTYTLSEILTQEEWLKIFKSTEEI